ncbi:MAG: hypothetical protein CG441_798 [Methylococcaceae bacterium NSM2-1]|nr:MAG: hypothetical protein CG441_798 [Methylococcaceae bacterium NSM2-1]
MVTISAWGAFVLSMKFILWTQVDEKTRRRFLYNAESRKKVLSNKVLKN